MSEAKKQIDEALKILSVISVNGDAVEIMAAAKNKLRRAAALLAEQEVPEHGR